MKRRDGQVPRATTLEYSVMIVILLVTLGALVIAQFDGIADAPSPGVVQVGPQGSGPPAP